MRARHHRRRHTSWDELGRVSGRKWLRHYEGRTHPLWAVFPWHALRGFLLAWARSSNSIKTRIEKKLNSSPFRRMLRGLEAQKEAHNGATIDVDALRAPFWAWGGGMRPRTYPSCEAREFSAVSW